MRRVKPVQLYIFIRLLKLRFYPGMMAFTCIVKCVRMNKYINFSLRSVSVNLHSIFIEMVRNTYFVMNYLSRLFSLT